MRLRKHIIATPLGQLRAREVKPAQFDQRFREMERDGASPG